MRTSGTGGVVGVVVNSAITAVDPRATDGVQGSVDASRGRHLDAISRLPQAAVLIPENVSRWLADTLRIDPERVEWHIQRAGGFGGSEAGLLLEWATRFNPVPITGAGWGTPARLVRQKLLMLAPDAPGVDARRGIALEPVIAQMFEENLAREGRVWARRDDLKRVVESGGHPAMPWMRASLDGLYEIDGKLWIVDFKAPSETSLEKHREKLSMGYVAQLNHYAMVARGFGVEVDGLALAMFDYRRFGEEPLAIFDVRPDLDLQRRIAEGGRSLWHEHVLTGQVPAMDDAVTDAVPEGLVEILEELRQVKRGVTDLMRRKDALSHEVLARMSAVGLERITVDLSEGSATVTLRRDLDAERAWERIDAFHAWKTDSERVMSGLHAPAFVDAEEAARWVMALRDALDALPPGVLPEGLAALVERMPEVAPGKPLRNPIRQALRAIGEDPRDFEVAVVSTRF
jgi:predicted phage-related endonuclease